MTSTGALDEAATALEALARAAERGWDGASGPEALEAAALLARAKAVVDGALVAVAERLEVTGAAESIGWASTRDFLTHVLGGRKGAGGGVVRLAQRTADLPAVREALTTGAVSAAQAGVIAGRVATLPRDPRLREEAAERMLALVAEEVAMPPTSTTRSVRWCASWIPTAPGSAATCPRSVRSAARTPRGSSR